MLAEHGILEMLMYNSNIKKFNANKENYIEKYNKI